MEKYIKNHITLSFVTLFICYICTSFVVGSFDPTFETTKSERETHLIVYIFSIALVNIFYHDFWSKKEKENKKN